jgi:AGCS family alanine or glycine:cation symporter
MISWSYYGLQAWKYLFGNSQTADYSYKLIFCIMVVIGAAANLKPVIGFSDAMIFAMCFPNIFGMFLLKDRVLMALNDYLSKIKNGIVYKHF